ncbi:MAG: hypothetical protein HY286_04540 [Planctomycetes bacterium]|nr:hypothetical protein [Planctomycetota bacterium]
MFTRLSIVILAAALAALLPFTPQSGHGSAAPQNPHAPPASNPSMSPSLQSAKPLAKTLAFQSGDGQGSISDNYDWRLMENYPGLTGTPWADSVVVGRDDSNGVGEHRWLINFPGVVGNAPGQVPIYAKISQATIDVYAPVAAHVPVSARRAIEYNLGQCGFVEGQDNKSAPNWRYRLPGVLWSNPGAGVPSSAFQTAEDTKTIEQDGAWATFNITNVLQSWADNPAANCGILFAAGDLSAPGQGFAGGGVAKSLRPILTVAYSIENDAVAPTLQIQTPVQSEVQRAFVEGAVGPDAVRVEFKVNDGPWLAAIRETSTKWCAWAELQQNKISQFAVRAADAAGNVAEASQPLRWSPTLVPASGGLLLAAAETVYIKFSPPPAGAVSISVDRGDGEAVVSAAGALGTAVTYNKQGEFTTTATALDANGAAVATATLHATVVRLVEDRPVVSQVAHERTMDFTIGPASAIGQIALVPRDPSYASVYIASVNNNTIYANLAAYNLNDPALQVRLGSPAGRLASETVIHSLTLTHSDVNYIDDPLADPNAAQKLVAFGVHAGPPGIFTIAPFLNIEVTLFSDGTAFPASVDPDQDKIVILSPGLFDMNGWASLTALFDPAAAPECCRALLALDTGAPDSITIHASDAMGQNDQPGKIVLTAGKVLGDPAEAPTICVGDTNFKYSTYVTNGSYVCIAPDGSQVGDPVAVAPTFDPANPDINTPGSKTVNIKWSVSITSGKCQGTDEKTDTFTFVVTAVGNLMAQSGSHCAQSTTEGGGSCDMTAFLAVCVNDTVTVTATPKGGYFPNGRPTWTTTTPSGAVIESAVDGAASFSFAATEKGDYSIVAACGASTQHITVEAIIIKELDINISGQKLMISKPNDPAPPMIVCAGTPMSFKAIPDGGPAFPPNVPTWTDEGSGLLANASVNGDTVTVNAPSIPGQFSLAATCNNDAFIVINVVKIDTLSATGPGGNKVTVTDAPGVPNELTVCVGDSVQLLVVPVGYYIFPPQQPQWTTVAPAGFAGPVNGLEVFTFNPPVVGDYVFTAKCGDELTVVIHVIDVKIEIAAAGNQDDIVRLKGTFPDKRFKVQCSVSVLAPKDLTVVLENPDGHVRFHESLTDNDISTELVLILPKDGMPVTFAISGETSSAVLGDALIEAHVDSPYGNVCGKIAATVFYLGDASIDLTKGAGSYVIYPDKISSDTPPAITYAAKATLKPAGVDCTVAQTKDLFIGITQNIKPTGTIIINNPVLVWDNGVPSGTQVAVHNSATLTLTSVGYLQDSIADADPLYDKPGLPGDETFDPDSLVKPVGCPPNTGIPGDAATSLDTPNALWGVISFPATKSDGSRVGTLNYTIASITSDGDFISWVVCYDQSDNSIQPIRQSHWTSHIDSTNLAGSGVTIMSLNSDVSVIPITGAPFGNEYSKTLSNFGINASPDTTVLTKP